MIGLGLGLQGAALLGGVSGPAFAPASLTGSQRAATHEVYGDSAGLWLEEALVANGVQDAGYSNANTDPTGWAFVFSNALTSTFTRTGPSGSSQGVLACSGSTAGDYYYQLGAANNFAGVTADSFLGSMKLRLAAGSLANISQIALVLVEYTAASGLVGAPASFAVSAVQQLQSDITFYNQVGPGFTAGATTAFVGLAIKFTAGGAFNFSLGIDEPKLEKRKWRSSFAVTSRAADALTHTMPAFPWSLSIIADMPRFQTAGTLWEVGSGSNRITLRHANYELFMTVLSGGSTLTDTSIGKMPPCGRFKLSVAAASGKIAASLNGKTAKTASITLPAVTAAKLGAGQNGAWNSTAFIPKTLGSALSDAALAADSKLIGGLFDDFDRADNAVLGTPPVGATWQQTGVTANSISSKKLVAAAGTTGSAYAISQLSAAPRYMGALFDWTSAAASGALGLIAATNDYLPSDPATSALHTLVSSQNERWQTVLGPTPTFTPPEPITATDLFTFPAEMTRDGATQYGACWMKSGNGVVWVGRDGELIRKVSSDYTAKIGPYAVIEHFWQSSACKPEIISVCAA